MSPQPVEVGTMQGVADSVLSTNDKIIRERVE
jgi:hypothetical protein